MPSITAMLSLPCRTWVTIRLRLRVVRPSAASSCETSSRPPASTSTDRSPAATASVSRTAWPRGPVSERVTNTPASAAMATAITQTLKRKARCRPKRDCASPAISRERALAYSEYSVEARVSAASSGRQSSFILTIASAFRSSSASLTMDSATGAYARSIRSISPTRTPSLSLTSLRPGDENKISSRYRATINRRANAVGHLSTRIDAIGKQREPIVADRERTERQARNQHDHTASTAKPVASLVLMGRWANMMKVFRLDYRADSRHGEARSRPRRSDLQAVFTLHRLLAWSARLFGDRIHWS